MIDIIIGFASLFNFILSWFTLNKNRKSLSNISFATLSFVIAIWAALFIPYTTPFLFDSLFWIKIIYLFVVLMVGSILFFSYSFPYGDVPDRKVLSLYFVLNIPVIYTLFFTNYFVQSIKQTSYGPETIVGPFYWYSSITWGIFGLAVAIYNLIRKYSKATGIAKLQLLYMFSGLGLFGISAAILDGFIPIFFKTSRFFSLSAAFSLFFVGLTTYSVVKHRLLDIRIAFQEIVVFLTTSFFISSIFLVSAISYWIFTGQPVKPAVLLIIVSISSILTILFEKLSSLAKKIAREYFSLSVYDYQKTLKDLSLRLSVHLELRKLVDILTQILAETFKLERVAIVLYEETDHKFILQKSLGFDNSNEKIYKLCDYLIRSHQNIVHKMLVLEEIKKLSTEANDEIKQNAFKQIAQVMEESGVSLVSPLLSNNKIISFIILGDKNSLDPYTIQDINFLNTIAYEASVAFQNAKSYEKIQRFNITLQEEVRKATSDLQEANNRLKQLDHLKDDFVSIASHELRTPMTAIRSYAWMALHRSDVPLSKTLEKYVARILISTERLINLVNDMLNVSRIESGRVEINPEPVDLLLLIKDIVDEVYYSKSEEKNVQFQVLEKPIPKVLADPEKLRQVFLNLVGNSLKFTPNGGKITFDFFTDGRVVETSISDTGVGISKEDISKLFHKFSRLDNSYTAAAASGGTGLGLYISKNLVELMHGRIWATSEGVNKGTLITVSLPIVSQDILKDIEKYRVKPAGETKGLEPAAI